jgi:hypothetical protein
LCFDISATSGILYVWDPNPSEECAQRHQKGKGDEEPGNRASMCIGLTYVHTKKYKLDDDRAELSCSCGNVMTSATIAGWENLGGELRQWHN